MSFERLRTKRMQLRKHRHWWRLPGDIRARSGGSHCSGMAVKGGVRGAGDDRRQAGRAAQGSSELPE